MQLLVNEIKYVENWEIRERAQRQIARNRSVHGQ